MDAALLGAGFLRVHADGRKERLDPAAVYVQPPATDDAAFLARMLAHAEAGECVTAEDVARLRKLADWADAPPPAGWNGTLDRKETGRAVEAAWKRLKNPAKENLGHE